MKQLRESGSKNSYNYLLNVNNYINYRLEKF